jgi:hypothetical protein
MKQTIVRTQEEIEELLNAAAEAVDEGTRFPILSYEEGMVELWRWLTDADVTYPLD